MNFTRGISEEEIIIDKKEVRYKLEPNTSDTIIFINKNDFVKTDTHINYQKKIYSTTCYKSTNSNNTCYFCNLFENGYPEFKLSPKLTFFFYSFNRDMLVGFDVNYKRGLEFIKIINKSNDNEYLSFNIRKYGQGIQSVIVLEPNHTFDDIYTKNLEKLKENNIKVTDNLINQFLSPINLEYSAILLNEKGYKVADFMDEEEFKKIYAKYNEIPFS